MRDEAEIRSEMSVQTVIVHENILADDYAWEGIQQFATNIWNNRHKYPKYATDNFAITYDLANYIQQIVEGHRPAFVANVWNDLIDNTMLYVDWFKIATWHLANLWAQARLDDNMEEMEG